jgi:hypothetical protein
MVQLHLERRPTTGWRRIKQIYRGAAQSVGQFAQYPEFRLDSAIFNLGEERRGPSNALAKYGQGQPSFPAQMAKAVTQHHRIECLYSHV